MALYSTSNLNGTTPAQTNITTTYTAPGHMLSLTAATATLRRGFIYEMSFGASGVPNATDCEIVWDLSAQTSLGTGASLVATTLDQADAATGMVIRGNYTIIPTVTANSSRFTLAANQRASYRWVVNPGGPGEMVVPATDVTGLVMRAKSSTYASTAIVCFLYRE